jgi:hypothetical protein
MIAILLAATLALPRGAEAVRIADDSWPEKTMEARAGERVWWWSADCAPQLLTDEAPAIECANPVSRRVHVVDRDSGKKLAGVRVIWGTDAMRTDLPDAMLPGAVTDAEGDLVLQVPANGGVRVRVDGPKVASWWQVLATGAAAQRLAAVPAAPAVLQLTIGGSEPASRAVVQLELSDVRSWAVAKDGRVTLPAIPPVPVMVAAWSEASAPAVVQLDAAMMPRTLDLPRGSSVSGRIVDARRRPIEGAAIEGVIAIGKLPRGLRRRARSTRSGTFVLRGIPTGPMQLKLKKPERATVIRRVEALDDVDLGDITLPASRQIALHVIDGAGQPVAGATIRVTDGPSGVTGRDGVARIEAVTAEDDVTVKVAAKGYRAAELDIPADAKFPLDVELSRGVRVVGTVVSAKSGERVGPGDVLVNNNGMQHIVSFDESGLIDIGGLAAGKLALEIRGAGLVPTKLDARTLGADETWELGTLRLDDGVVLTGRVFDGEAPLPGARVRALRRGGANAALAVVMNDWIAATAGDDGTFTLSGLGEGSHVLLVDAAGFAPRVLTAAADAEALKVKLERARSLVIDCAPVRRCGAEARLLYAGPEYPWAAASAAIQDGKARIVAAGPGAAVLRLVGEGHILHERPVQIGAAAETEVQIRLVSATLRGTVSSAGRLRRDGGIVELRASIATSAGIPIYVENQTPDGQSVGGGWQSELPSLESAPVDESGQFLFAELEPGEYVATYRHEGIASKPVTLMVRPGTSHVTLEIAPEEISSR